LALYKTVIRSIKNYGEIVKMLIEFLILIMIVGFVTAGLNIKFDRFFAVLLLLFIFKFTPFEAINTFLWIIMLGALMIILDNKDQIASLPKKMKIKLFVLIPVFTLIASFFGSWMFSLIGSPVLIVTLGILAILYGLRLIFIHFKQEELNQNTLFKNIFFIENLKYKIIR